ncbi:MAG TPA: DUF4405 domain-containing protein [Hyphomicrobiaceae bacterium]|nr:DUF4405 domain-containing protein [Hyphomicrobiaceae bacterium]
MKISRDWATPITIGSFLLMSVTGILMFFHLDIGLNKLAHEWLGWIMVAGVGAHAIANWQAFKRYFVSSPVGRTLIALAIVVTLGSFASMPGAKNGFPPHIMAMKAVTNAPIKDIAPMTGRTVPELIEALSQANIALPTPDASIESVVKGDRKLEAKAMRALFGKG